MALIAAHLNAGHSGGDKDSVREATAEVQLITETSYESPAPLACS